MAGPPPTNLEELLNVTLLSPAPPANEYHSDYRMVVLTPIGVSPVQVSIFLTGHQVAGLEFFVTGDTLVPVT